jgi:hypothetical protein
MEDSRHVPIHVLHAVAIPESGIFWTRIWVAQALAMTLVLDVAETARLLRLKVGGLRSHKMREEELTHVKVT